MSKTEYLLTIDVGTVNLAYCLASYEIKNDQKILDSVNLIDWGILDVSYKPLYCKQIKNKRAICNCISKFYTLKEGTQDHSNPENLIGYCKSHAKPIKEFNKKNKIKIHNISDNPIYKNSFNLQMERLLSSLEKFYTNVIKTPYDVEKKSYNTDDVGNINTNTKINNIDIIKDDDFYYKIKYVSNLKIYIENQPVFKNPIMKTISIGIYTFFTLKKVLEPNIISNINFINATVKTKDDFVSKLFEIVGVKSYINKFKDYDKRKEFTEDITNQMIFKLPKTINNGLSTHKYVLAKKKDDMADTFVYVIYVILYMLTTK